MKIKPLHDRVLVRRVEEVTRTSGGIIIPDTAKEKPLEGIVEAVGTGKIGTETYIGTEDFSDYIIIDAD